MIDSHRRAYTKISANQRLVYAQVHPTDLSMSWDYLPLIFRTLSMTSENDQFSYVE